MQLTKFLQQTLASVLQQIGLAWWIEIVTTEPNCTYYFGPFTSSEEAQIAQSGYIEDIEHEGAQKVRAQIKWCKPRELTVYDDES